MNMVAAIQFVIIQGLISSIILFILYSLKDNIRRFEFLVLLTRLHLFLLWKIIVIAN